MSHNDERCLRSQPEYRAAAHRTLRDVIVFIFLSSLLFLETILHLFHAAASATKVLAGFFTPWTMHSSLLPWYKPLENWYIITLPAVRKEALEEHLEKCVRLKRLDGGGMLFTAHSLNSALPTLNASSGVKHNSLSHSTHKRPLAIPAMSNFFEQFHSVVYPSFPDVITTNHSAAFTRLSVVSGLTPTLDPANSPEEQIYLCPSPPLRSKERFSYREQREVGAWNRLPRRSAGGLAPAPIKHRRPNHQQQVMVSKQRAETI
jgi:hypothetical protein